MSNGNPPVGTSSGFDHTDPDAPAEERQMTRPQDAQDRLGTLDRELPNEPMSAERKVEQIVVREQGVNSFAHAEEADRMERPPSVRDQETDGPGNIIARTIQGTADALTDDDTNRDARR